MRRLLALRIGLLPCGTLLAMSTQVPATATASDETARPDIVIAKVRGVPRGDGDYGPGQVVTRRPATAQSGGNIAVENDSNTEATFRVAAFSSSRWFAMRIFHIGRAVTRQVRAEVFAVQLAAGERITLRATIRTPWWSLRKHGTSSRSRNFAR